jgi:hypothetical protein
MRYSTRARQGIAIWVVLGALTVLAIAGLMLLTKSQSSLRQLQLAKEEFQLRWVGESVMAHLQNRLKKTSWSRRFYRQRNVPSYEMNMNYREHSCWCLLMDSVKAGVVQTGTTDIFVQVGSGEVELGLHQRVHLGSGQPTDPGVLTVLHEKCVRNNVRQAAQRTKLLREMDEDLRAAERNAAEADVSLRLSMDAARGGQNYDQIRGALARVPPEAATERRFRELIVAARAACDRGSPAEAMRSLTEALSIATSSTPAQRLQRMQAARLTVARVERLMALTGPLPERGNHLTAAQTSLDALIREQVPLCEGVTRQAVIESGEVRVAQRNPRTPEERTRVSRDVSSSIATQLQGLGQPPGMPLPEQSRDRFTNQQSARLAYLERSYTGGPTDDGREEYIVLADADGRNATRILGPGRFIPHLWLADGSALLTDIGEVSRSTSDWGMALIDRSGTILKRFPQLSAYRDKSSDGIYLLPNQNAFVFRGTAGSSDELAYWVQDLSGGAPRKILTTQSYTDEDLHDHLAVSDNGRWVSYIDSRDNPATLKVATAESFASGSPSGTTVFTFSSREVPPDMAWTMEEGDPQLILRAGLGDRDHPEKGHLMLVNPTNGQKQNSPDFPADFRPNFILPFSDRQHLAVVDSVNGQVAEIGFNTTGFTGTFTPRTISGLAFNGRPTRGDGNLVYFSTVAEWQTPSNRGGPAAIWQWNMGSGDPARVPLARTGTTLPTGAFTLPITPRARPAPTSN